MPRSIVDRATIHEFLVRLGAASHSPALVYLIGATSQVFEGWRDYAEQLEFSVELASEERTAFQEVVRDLQTRMEIRLSEESPGDVIPLPAGYADRVRPIGKVSFGQLRVHHFDPYSVAFRLIVRGDEQDYSVVLTFLQHDWLRVDEMNSLLTDLLPRFSSETIQQDPAEFRRKFKGLLQMWHAARARQSQATF
ncbi:MAG: hypothetical protein HY070_13210 [Chloroflexi bacterium]|nr:hypothetical protein [Chloroflexota bacterium]